MRIQNFKAVALLSALFIVATFSNAAFAQKNKAKSKKVNAASMVHQKWELGMFFGGTQYQGDLQKTDTKEFNPGIGALARYHINDNFALRGNFLYGTLTGNDNNYDDRKARAFSFKSPVRELSLLAEYDILGKKRYANLDQGVFKKTVSPYLFAGLGFANVNPITDFRDAVTNGNKISIAADRAVKTKKGSVAIPLGAGLKFDISKYWWVGVEAVFRYTFTDFLDGVSKAGNPDKKDTYFSGGLVLSYRIPHIKDTDGDGIEDETDACPTVPGPIKSKGCPDKDGDGVGDVFDNCPDVVGLRSMGGCPDTDRDGVMDQADQCPDVIGLKELNGCPDADEDGVPDKDDECPTVKGLRDYAGCPTRDTDGDGVEDRSDKCPKEKGLKENSGCPYTDEDGDGVLDKDDVCPDIKGLARFNGCPDSDQDGIEDSKDKCPDVPGVSFLQGCPEMKQEDKDVLRNAVYGIEFETGSAKLRNLSYPILDNVVSVLQKYPAYTMSIAGNTDNLGRPKDNQRLSELRAKACYDYFISKQIQANRMSFIGNGSSAPVAPNTTAAGRAKNRRVDFQLFVK